MNGLIDGTCDTRFAPVRAAFEANFDHEEEVGSAICIRVDGMKVVDLWGGHRDAERSRAWKRDTLVNAFSVGKGILAALVVTLVERRILDYDASIENLWPEFAAAGKAGVTLRTLMAHQAGLPAVRERMPADAMLDWHRICDALASQEPFWQPGTRHGYHVNTYGYLVGEVVRRATGMRVGDALREFVTGPLEADYFWGLPAPLHPRASDVIMPGGDDVDFSDEAIHESAFPPTGDDAHDSMIRLAYFNPSGISGLGWVNRPEWRSAEIPSTNGQTTARAVARIYQALLGRSQRPGMLASPELIDEATSIHSDGDDAVLGKPSRFGLGFQLTQPTRLIGPNPKTFGHFGYGGSIGFADPDAEIAFSYVINRPGDRWQTPRTQALMDAVYDALD